MLNLKQQKPKLNKICLATSDGFDFIEVNKILYCKAEGSYTEFVINNSEKLLVSKHLKEYENLLLEQDFMRVHNSYLINLKEVKKYVKSDGGYIIMNNGDIVSVTRSKKEDFIKVMSYLTN
ncbi:LytTR family transcriptional regulator [Sabulilitoribacter arenilitoris]|uniref:LytTR family transcriptional regulator n=1 Tax=Wocania arenilitoris TaxID=2044858 RepID=A0AAE3EP09_9FLAO|nr:LytTR family DNA-binding domain-containing protein [Wocania arenilitoris]MCF7567917.1 LytTR family transcriptional regulator [Wocania arenilitoris]